MPLQPRGSLQKQSSGSDYELVMMSASSGSGGGQRLQRPQQQQTDYYTSHDDNSNNNGNDEIIKAHPPNFCFFRRPQHWRLLAAFWFVGLMNHSAYIIMLACAKDILEGGTALVFLANILPGLAIKTSAPYWFHAVSYETRIQFGTISVMTGYILVAAASSARSSRDSNSILLVIVQLLGVGMANAQCALGEASLLALAGLVDAALEDQNSSTSHYNNNYNNNNSDGSAPVLEESDYLNASNNLQTNNSSNQKARQNSGHCLTSLSSGTGMAGVFGFLWKWFWNNYLGWTLSETLVLALILAVAYWMTFQYIRRHQPPTTKLLMKSKKIDDPIYGPPCEEILDPTRLGFPPKNANKLQPADEMQILTEETRMIASPPLPPATITASTPDGLDYHADSDGVIHIPDMTSAQRFQLVLSLWPYMLPLFVVYAAEYALQSGVWTAIGFPVQDRASRTHFYQFSNWTYFVGSFLSRSSGVLYTAPMWVLWLMPALQFGNLIVFAHVAAHTEESHFLYHPFILYAGALFAGCLGGSVYISGYKRICVDLPLAHREFALSATSLAETAGIVVADILGLVIQACLYEVNGLGENAMLSCPVNV